MKEVARIKKMFKKWERRKKVFEKKRLFERVLESLKKVPEVKGRIVQRTANDYFGRSWKKGIIVSYLSKKGEWKKIKHNAKVWYEHIFPSTCWLEKTTETVAEQLLQLYEDRVIDLDTKIKFEFLDYEDKVYNHNQKIIVPLGVIIEEVITYGAIYRKAKEEIKTMA